MCESLTLWIAVVIFIFSEASPSAGSTLSRDARENRMGLALNSAITARARLGVTALTGRAGGDPAVPTNQTCLPMRRVADSPDHASSVGQSDSASWQQVAAVKTPEMRQV